MSASGLPGMGRVFLGVGALVVGVAGAGAAAPEPGSPPLAATSVPGSSKTLVMLPLRAYQQTTPYTCGPATLLTLLHYYHRDADEMKIAEEAKCSKEKGTTPQNMVAWLESHGFDVKWGEHGSLEMLRENLAKGIPTIVEWIDWGGHWVTVVGYDTRGTENPRDDVIYFADPADGIDGMRDGLTSFNARKFNSMWFDAFLFDRPMFKVYIIATPKKPAGTN
jgi:hypothetical protein